MDNALPQESEAIDVMEVSDFYPPKFSVSCSCKHRKAARRAQFLKESLQKGVFNDGEPGDGSFAVPCTSLSTDSTLVYA